MKLKSGLNDLLANCPMFGEFQENDSFRAI